MPYIPQPDRVRFQPGLETLAKEIISNGVSAGDLNYLMTTLAIFYVAKHGQSYNVLSDVGKTFDYAAREFYRRKVAPYEDEKIRQNGDVY